MLFECASELITFLYQRNSHLTGLSIISRSDFCECLGSYWLTLCFTAIGLPHL